MKRRSFLLGSGSLTVSGLLSSCNAEQQATLRVQLLKDSIPAQLLNEFSQKIKQKARLDLTVEPQLISLFNRLQIWQEKPRSKEWWSDLPLPLVKQRVTPVADLVSLGDYWLAAAIERKLIQPLDPSQFSQWKNLSPRWQELVRRNEQGKPDPKGKIWGAPYRWGTTMIAYRRDKFQDLGLQPPKDWSDLWRKDLSDRISLLDQPREVIGLTLKKIHPKNSFNTEQLDKIPNLKSELKALNQQVKFYSDDAYLQPLILGDTWVAVGWSTDILPTIQHYSNIIAAVVPQSGTALWADVWVRPAKANSNFDLEKNWIDFYWQWEIALLLSRFSRAASPVLTGEKPNDSHIRSLILPAPNVFQNSEFILPISQKAISQYQALWREVRFQGLGIRDRVGSRE